MAHKIGGFKTDAMREAYQATYECIRTQHWPVPHEDLDLDSSYGTTHIRRSDGGDATPLLLLHPTTGSSLGWYPVVAPLTEDRDVYTPDTIGTCGMSVQRAPITSVEDLVAWLDEIMDRLELERVHLLGYSEGGWIAGSHAALSPHRDRLASVTLVEPGGAIQRIPPLFLAQMIARAMLAIASRDRTAALARFNTWLNGDVELTDAQVDLLEVSMGTFRQRLPTPGRLNDDQLRRVAAPTLLMMAEETKLYDPAKVAARARDLIDDLTIDITPDAGHGLLFQHPAELTSRINGFLARHD